MTRPSPENLGLLVLFALVRPADPDEIDTGGPDEAEANRVGIGVTSEEICAKGTVVDEGDMPVAENVGSIAWDAFGATVKEPPGGVQL